jgi:hypothetical protein
MDGPEAPQSLLPATADTAVAHGPSAAVTAQSAAYFPANRSVALSASECDFSPSFRDGLER